MAIRTPSPSTQERKATPGRVLVVDDERLVARVLARTLEAAGHEVKTCYDGAAALVEIAKSDFDLVLSDISMPGLDGIELLRSVRQLELDLPVVLVTGTPSMHSAIDAVEYGALRYLQKPVDSAVLRETVNRAIALRQVGRLRREMFDELGQSGRHIADRADLEVRFERALAGAYVVFQPVVSWLTRTVYAYEAFVRTDEASMVRPLDLIEAAERLGRLNELRARIHRLCADRLQDVPPYALLFVNIHIKDLIDIERFEQESALMEHAHRIVLEVTERAALDLIGDVRPRIARLRSQGFRIALDDLGAGYAGLNSFTLLDPDIVKLDMSLTRDVDSLPTKRRLVASMTRLCSELGMQVVAEGIESVDERDTLSELGCDLMQGYLFAQPSETMVTPHLPAEA